ncbi:MAG TPA: DUF445 domain-containing protein [Anaerolineae bacterium]|nr:DUF445 domain-containing protein [Anaerolineae bacterium]
MYVEPNRQEELGRMKLIATGLLVVATLIFAVASIFEEQAVWIGFIRATAEAAMVGAIADWFAVTAIFRHPLGLKIPHTAIVPTRKDAIGRTLGRFVKNNFLSPEVISGRLKSMDATRQLARWLSDTNNSGLIANYLAVGLAGVVEVVKDEEVQGLIEQNIAGRLRSTKVAPILGEILSLVASGNRQQELLEGTLNLAASVLDDNRDVIKKKISEETPWWLPQNVDNVIYQKIVDAAHRTLQEVKLKPDHPLRAHFNDTLTKFIDDLKHSPDVLSKEEAFKEELLQNPVVREFSSSLWRDIKRALISGSDNPDSDVRKPIQHGIARFGKTVLENEDLLLKIDHWVYTAALYLVREYGHEVEHLIAQTIARWDAEETSNKIELQVGRDLQFIRINGTIVGGLVGFLIPAISFLLK